MALIYNQKLCDQNRIIDGLTGTVTKACFYPVKENYIYCMVDDFTEEVAQCVYNGTINEFKTKDITKDMNYKPGPSKIANTMCKEEVEKYDYNEEVNTDENFISTTVLDLLFDGQENCKVVFPTVEKIFKKQKDELRHAIAYLEEMQQEQERLNLLSKNGVKVKPAQIENTAISFEFGNDAELIGSITGAANENIVVVTHGFKLNNKDNKHDFKMNFAADLSKKVVDYTFNASGQAKNEEEQMETYKVEEIVTTEDGALPKISVAMNGTSGNSYTKFTASISTVKKNHLAVSALGSSDEYPQPEALKFEVIRKDDGTCEVK